MLLLLQVISFPAHNERGQRLFGFANFCPAAAAEENYVVTLLSTMATCSWYG